MVKFKVFLSKSFAEGRNLPTISEFFRPAALSEWVEKENLKVNGNTLYSKGVSVGNVEVSTVGRGVPDQGPELVTRDQTREFILLKVREKSPFTLDEAEAVIRNLR